MSTVDDFCEELFWSVRSNDTEVFSELANKAESLNNIVDERRNTLIHYAAANNALDILTFLLNKCEKEYIFKTNESGNSPLHWASLNGHISAVRLLLDHGVSPLVENEFGSSPIDEAIKLNNTDLISLFTEYVDKLPEHTIETDS